MASKVPPPTTGGYHPQCDCGMCQNMRALWGDPIEMQRYLFWGNVIVAGAGLAFVALVAAIAYKHIA